MLSGQAVVVIDEESYLLGAGDYGAVKVGTPHGWRAVGAAPVRWLQMDAPQPKPAGAERDTFFPKGHAVPLSAPPLGSGEPAREPPGPLRRQPDSAGAGAAERAQGPRGRVPELAHRRELRRRAPPAALHRVPARRQHRPARPHLRRGLLHPERRGRGHDGRQEVPRPGPATCCGPAWGASTPSPTSARAGDLARDVRAAAPEGERVPLHGGMEHESHGSWRDRTHDSDRWPHAAIHRRGVPREPPRRARDLHLRRNASRTSPRIRRSATPRA